MPLPGGDGKNIKELKSTTPAAPVLFAQYPLFGS